MSGHAHIHLEIRDSVALATLDHPPANTWDREMLAGLENVLADLEARPAVRCLVLTGAGARYFSAGADLRQFQAASQEDALALVSAFHHAFERLASFHGVTIAAINGFALGGGLECALACDFRIAEQHTFLGLPEARVGLLPGGGGTQRLPFLIGEAWAKRLILLGERLDAATAERIGLVHEVVPSGTSVDAAVRWAAHADAASPAAISACKMLIEGAREFPMSECLQRERRAFMKLFGTVDQREGIRAFFEKRSPVWTTA